ncbi:bifunctional transcriptional activator/DNA repair enzyme AdaA [Paenibacillus gansuensis]|uniref:Bifunctional transcriptional activator/DNA repair enzyme AdaA n=1 Tax=Paenibacillus gansuensis TaxID=306542 RepID=A0ABW5PAQ4_9BACL
MDQQLFDEIYESVQKKEQTFDGVYYTCVKTTKIVCRPSCRARTPYRENVSFVKSVQEAVKAGYRPCKRCKPEEPGRQSPDERIADRVDELIKSGASGNVTLATLAEELAVSPFHLQRLYKRVRGHSPADQLKIARLEIARNMLDHGSDPVSAVAASTGFRTASHFAAWFGKETGFSPTEYREMHRKGVSVDE